MRCGRLRSRILAHLSAGFLLVFLCAGSTAGWADDLFGDASSTDPQIRAGALPSTPSAAETASQKASIGGKVSELMNEKYVPPSAAGAGGYAATNYAQAAQMPSSVAQSEQQSTIANDVSRLFHEKLNPTAPTIAQPASVPQPAALPTSEVAVSPGMETPSTASVAADTSAASLSGPVAATEVPPSPSSSPPAAPASSTSAADGGALPVAVAAGSGAAGLAAGAALSASAQVPGAAAAVGAPAASTAASVPAAAVSEAAPATASLGAASVTSAAGVSENPLPRFPAPTPPTPSPSPVFSVNSEAANNPTAPRLAGEASVPPSDTLRQSETNHWDKTAQDPALHQPIGQNTPAQAKAAASEAASAAWMGRAANNEKEGNLSDVPDAAFIRQLAGTNGLLNLDISDVTSPAEADRSTPIDKPVHIEEAVAFALKNNFDVQASDEKLRGAFWDKMGAFAQYGPAAEYDWDEGSEKSDPAAINDANGNRVLDNSHHRRDTNFTLRQPLIDLGVVAGILSARDKQGVVRADARDVQEGVASDTVNAFLKLVQARIAIRLADQYKSYLDNLGTRMTARVEGGGGTSADLDRIKSRSELAYSARIEALGEYETDLAELRRLTKIRPQQIQIPELLAPPVPETIDEALDKAVRGNPAYQSSLGKIDAAADDRDKSYAGLVPRLSLQYNKSFNYDAGGAAEGNPVDGVYPDQKEESVLLVAQWALNGTAVTSGLSGQSKMRETRLQSQDVLDRMEQAVRSSYTAINAARQRRGVLQRTVAANERVVQGFEEQYKEGTRSLFDVLDSYEQLYNSKLNLMRVVIANAEASYQVRREMGQLVTTLVHHEVED